MTFAILKLSYNSPGQTPVIGGICGTGFFLTHNLAVTGSHVLSATNYKPNDGFRYCQFWLLPRYGNAIPVAQANLRDASEIDATFLVFSRPLDIRVRLSLSLIPATVMEEVTNEGYVSDKMPEMSARWTNGLLVIDAFDTIGLTADSEGYIKRLLTLDNQCSGY